MTHMSPRERVLQLVRRQPLFRLSDAAAAGVHREAIRRLTKRKELVRVGRGLYALPSLRATENHTLVEVAKRVPRGVICLLSALRFHAMGTQNPREVWLAVDRRAGIPRVDFAALRVVRLSATARAIGVDVAVEALRDYRRLRKGTVDELWRQADRLRMTRVMRPYWDAMS